MLSQKASVHKIVHLLEVVYVYVQEILFQRTR